MAQNEKKEIFAETFRKKKIRLKVSLSKLSEIFRKILLCKAKGKFLAEHISKVRRILCYKHIFSERCLQYLHNELKNFKKL